MHGSTAARDASSGATSPDDLSTFSSLQFRDYRYLWAGGALSSVGHWLQQVSIGWIAYDITGSGTVLGSINAVRFITALVIGLLSGVMVDRLDRGKLMVWLPLFLCASSCILGGVLLTDNVRMWHLFVFMFVFGAVQAFEQPVRTTVLFDLVPRSHIPNAVALNIAASSITRALGPGIGGFLLSIIGAAGNFFFQAAAYLVAAATRFAIRLPPKKPLPRRNMASDFREGFAFIFKGKLVRAYVFISFVAPLLLIPTFNALPPIYAKDVYHRGPEALGFIIGSVGLGGLLGALFTASLGRMDRRGYVQLGSLLIFALALIGYSFCRSFWFSLPVLVFAGFAEMILITTNQMLIQLIIPDALRARVTSVLLLSNGFLPLGALIAGAGADAIGAPMITRVMAAAAAAIALLFLIASPTVRDIRMSALIAGSPQQSAQQPKPTAP